MGKQRELNEKRQYFFAVLYFLFYFLFSFYFFSMLEKEHIKLL